MKTILEEMLDKAGFIYHRGMNGRPQVYGRDENVKTVAKDDGTTRKFDTGATRDTAEGKLDYEGFYSPLVMERFARYMHGHRQQSDGVLRDSDNWQKGMPLSVYIKSLWRHLVTVWHRHRGHALAGNDESMEMALCGILFNASGYLHELLKDNTAKDRGWDPYAENAHIADLNARNKM